MFENVVGRLVGGALWGLGAGVALALVKGGGGGARPLAKAAMKGYIVVADRLQETLAEARETLDDARAEIDAERATVDAGAVAPAPAPRRRPRGA